MPLCTLLRSTRADDPAQRAPRRARLTPLAQPLALVGRAPSHLVANQRKERRRQAEVEAALAAALEEEEEEEQEEVARQHTATDQTKQTEQAHLTQGRNGFGLVLDDSLQVLGAIEGSSAATADVPLHSHVLEVAGVAVGSKRDLMEVVTGEAGFRSRDAQPSHPSPLRFVLSTPQQPAGVSTDTDETAAPTEEATRIAAAKLQASKEKQAARLRAEEEAQAKQQAEVEAALDECEARFGTVNALVSCAGIAVASRTVSKKGAHSLDDFSRVLHVNTTGTFNVLRLAAERYVFGANEGGNARFLSVL